MYSLEVNTYGSVGSYGSDHHYGPVVPSQWNPANAQLAASPWTNSQCFLPEQLQQQQLQQQQVWQADPAAAMPPAMWSSSVSVISSNNGGVYVTGGYSSQQGWAAAVPPPQLTPLMQGRCRSQSFASNSCQGPQSANSRGGCVISN